MLPRVPSGCAGLHPPGAPGQSGAPSGRTDAPPKVSRTHRGRLRLGVRYRTPIIRIQIREVGDERTEEEQHAQPICAKAKARG